MAIGNAAVTPHELSTRAAMHIYQLGGNAVDAAIAANAVQGVVAPETCGIGGDLFALVYADGDAAPAALNASGRAGSGADPVSLRSAGHSTIPPFDSATVTIPGCVDGWSALSERFGTMPLIDVLAPAIEHAERGFAASAEFTRAFARRAEQLAPQAPELYTSQDTVVRREALARTLRQIAEGGRASFYKGPAGNAITQAVTSISKSDLATEQAEWVSPISAEVFGRTGWTVPPNSQGYLTLASAWVFSETRPPPDPDDPDYVHLQIEAYRSVAWERDDLVCDPARAPLPADHLAAPDRLRDRTAQIDRRRARSLAATGARTRRHRLPLLCRPQRHGRVADPIQLHGYRFRDRRPGHGLLPPQQGRRLQPDRRPPEPNSPRAPDPSTPSHPPCGPATVPSTRCSAPAVARINRNSCFRSRRRHYLSVTSPKQHCDVRARVLDGEEVRVEGGMSDAIVAELARRGHRVAAAGNSEPGWGPVSMIRVMADGSRSAAADPRVATTLALVDR